MKNIFRWMLILAVMGGFAGQGGRLLAQFNDAAGQKSTVITIRADGTCQYEDRSTVSRKIAEQQIHMMERYRNLDDNGDANEAAKPPETNTDDTPKPMTDAELKKKVIAMHELRFGAEESDSKAQMQAEVTAENVVVTTTCAYASLTEMLQSPSHSITVDMFTGVRLEQDTNRHLRVTFTPQKMMKRYLKSMRSAWKMSGMNLEVKLVFPGKVLSSAFTKTDGNTTTFVIDAKSDESLDAYEKLLEAPAVVTAELGGLSIKEPLETEKLQRSFVRHDNENDDLPLTEGGAGFVARSEGIVTTTVHIFPEGKDYFKDTSPFEGRPGAVVSAKIFPPRGRTLQSLNGVRVLKVTDDKGRAIAPAATGDEEISMMNRFSSGDDSENNSMQIQLRLQLPQPDAQAIDELNAEAIAVSAGKWKEMVLTNLTETSTNEFDLGDVLAGAKFKITKLTNKNNMLRLEGQLKGPATVRRLEVKVKMPEDSPNYQMHMGGANGGRFTAKGDESTRAISINMPMYRRGGGGTSGPVALLIRFPEDLRREKIPIKLTGLDLL